MKNKNKKILIKIGIVLIALFVVIGLMNRSYGMTIVGDIVGNIAYVGILALAIQYFILLLGASAQGLITELGTFNTLPKEVTGIEPGTGSLKDILFNQCGITTPNYFSGKPYNVTIGTIAEQIGKYYIVLRNLAIAILLCILLYIGIRMAISTVASKEAKYKKMLANWAVSLVILFVLHYIMIFTLSFNSIIVNALYRTLGQDVGVWDYVKLVGQAAIPFGGWPFLIVYVALVVMNLIFMLMYIKRNITIGFLIVISPLITITYSIDKMGDGKSQALNTWLKEFIFTVLIQPFHCIIYIVFVKTAIAISGQGLAGAVVGIVCMMFMLQSEKIVKKIFGIQADSMGDALTTGAMALGIMKSAAGARKGKKSGESGKRAPKMTNNKDGKSSISQSSQTSTNNRTENSNETATEQASNNNDTSTNQQSQEQAQAQDQTQDQTQEHTQTQEQAQAQEQDQDQQPIKDALKNSAWSNFKHGFASPFKRRTDADNFKDIAKAIPGKAFRGALTGIGAIAGGVIAEDDFSGALTTGLAVHQGTQNWKSNSVGNYNEKQLKENEEVFAGAYKDYATEYRRRYGEDVTDEQILREAKRLFEDAELGMELDDYQKDFYKQMKAMNDTYEALGYDDGWQGVQHSIELAQDNKITPNSKWMPKNYNTTSTQNNNTSGADEED